MSGVGQSEEGVEASTSGMMETTMMEGEEYYNPDDTGTWTQKEMSEQLCRICAKPNQYLIPIFEGEGIEHQLEPKIQKHLPIVVSETDELPLQVCYQCASTLIAWNDLVIACIEADKKLQQMLERQEEDEDDKGAEFFDEPVLDSDEGEDPIQPSTSSATATATVTSDTPLAKRSPGKAKKAKLKVTLVKSPTAGPSGQKSLLKKTAVNSKDDGGQEGTERYITGWSPPPETRKKCEGIFTDPGFADYGVFTSEYRIVKKEVVSRQCQLCGKGGMDDDELKAHAITHIKGGAPKVRADNISVRVGRTYSRPKKKQVIVNHIKCSVSDQGSKPLIYSCSLCGHGNIFISSLSLHIRKKCIVQLDTEAETDTDGEMLNNDDTTSEVFSVDEDSRDSRVSTKSQNAKNLNVKFMKHIGSDNIIEEIVTAFSRPKVKASCDESGLVFQLLEIDSQAKPQMVTKESLASCLATAGDNKSLHSALLYGTFGFEFNLFDHGVKIQEESLKCEDCGEEFVSTVELLKHQKNIHSDKQHFLCFICGKTYSLRHRLQHHINGHKKDSAQCDVCNKTFYNEMMLNTHTLMHTGEHPFKCSLCDKGFIFHTSLDQHVSKVHNIEKKAYLCAICAQGFKTGNGLKRHQEREHSENKSNHLCPTCGKIFATSYKLATHMVTHGPRKYACEICGFKFYSTYMLKNHLMRHQNKKDYICETCGETFYLPSELKRHVFNHHTNELPEKCMHCDRAFKFPHRLKQHMILSHRIIPEGKKIFSCNICDQIYVDKTRLMDHMNLHSGSRPYLCTVCNRRFRTRHSLSQHTDIHAVNPKPKNMVPCDVCGKKFKNEQTCKIHMQSFHRTEAGNPVSFPCDKCEKIFTTEWTFKRHKIIYHSEAREKDSPRFQCNFCDLAFYTNATLVRHKRVAHALINDGRPFQCIQCEKSYKTNACLYQHKLRKHESKNKLHPCKLCKKVMQSASSLYLHNRLQHGIHAREFVCERCGKSFGLKHSLAKHQRTHNRDMEDKKVFTCELCYKDLSSKWSLKVHMRAHKGIKPFACDVCGRAFTQSGDRNKHRNAHKQIAVPNQDF